MSLQLARSRLLEELLDRDLCLITLSSLEVIHPVGDVRDHFAGRRSCRSYGWLGRGFDLVLLYDLYFHSFLHYCVLLVLVEMYEFRM